MTQQTAETFWAPVLALEAACVALKGGSLDAVDSIKRIAGRIVDVARAAGMARTATAAAVLTGTRAEDIGDVADTVLDFIRTEISTTSEQRRTILVVDDDRLTSAVMRDVLETPECNTVVAETLAEARRVIETEEIAVILLDLVLPDGDGRDLLLELRNRPRTAWLPVIVLTARDDALTQSECYALGADGYLVKPVDWEVLKSAVSAKARRSAHSQFDTQLDPVTMLPDRAAFWDAFERALGERDGDPLSVAVINLDSFRAINTGFGQESGDRALRVIARVLANSLRGRDFIAPWGGDEFCVFLPQTGLAAASRVLNNALQRIRQTAIAASDGRYFTLTFSAGVATVAAGIGGGDALAQADRLLHLAKKSGRNRICSTAEARAASAYSRGG